MYKQVFGPSQSVETKFARPIVGGIMSFRVLITAFLVAGLWACASEPVGRKDLLDFIKDGITTKEDVIQHLAGPSTSLENGHILTYWIDEDSFGFLPPGTTDRWPKKFSLVLVFDEKGVLRRHSLVLVKE